MQLQGNLNDVFFGDIIKEIRKQLGFNSEQFCVGTKLHPVSLELIEENLALPDNEELRRILRFVSLNIDDEKDRSSIQLGVMLAYDEVQKLRKKADFLTRQDEYNAKRIKFLQELVEEKENDVQRLANYQQANTVAKATTANKPLMAVASVLVLLIASLFTIDLYKPEQQRITLLPSKNNPITAKIPPKKRKAVFAKSSKKQNNKSLNTGFEDFIASKNRYIAIDNSQIVSATQGATLYWRIKRPLSGGGKFMLLGGSIYDAPLFAQEISANQDSIRLEKLKPGAYHYKLVFSNVTVFGRFTAK
ncbi:hypothetical protein BKI52_02530 [marine bacterium AO1-C]|nr:hypothetical protein BKI52_02530 [marine bacterium AO1-C]